MQHYKKKTSTNKRYRKFSVNDSVNDILFETSTEFLVNLSELDNVIFSCLFLPVRVEFYESIAEWKVT
jgi:hypothetical protein